MTAITAETKKKPQPTFTITVNRKSVEMPDKHATGMHIKQAAIAQGVQIGLDFQLSQKVDNKWEIIDDNEKVRVDKHPEFTAVDGDDNS
jgi:hypothetical protein